MDYNRAVEYVNSFINFEKIPQYNYGVSFKLERMQAILEELGNPHQGLKVIHVAGSKGKGSTCAIAAYILKEAGFKVGLYTSPHLVDFRERIRVLYRETRNPEPLTSFGYGAGQRTETRDELQATSDFEGMIGEDEFRELVERIKPVAEKFRHHKSLGSASFFEIITACAFLYFKEKEVNFVVLETGLGGRLDATNVIEAITSGITNISLEHTDKLGNSLASIAFEKTGIIKNRCSMLDAGCSVEGGRAKVVTSSQHKEAMDVIKKACKERNADLYEVGRDVKYSILSSDINSQHFNLEGPGYSYEDLELSLIGQYQIENAAISIAMVKLLSNVDIPEDAIRKGLKNVIWPGRLQIIQREPYIIFDGAQNPASILTLLSSIKKLFRYNRLICVFGISSDKDIKGVSSLLEVFTNIVILTKAENNPRAVEPMYLKDKFLAPETSLELTRNVQSALQKALNIADKKDLILVTGSLFVVGDALRSRNLRGI